MNAPYRRLALGTAQLGVAYGVANQTGQVALSEAIRIVDLAREAGVDTLDTAISYGDSESRLGAVGVGGLRVVSKLPAAPNLLPSAHGWAHSAVEESLLRLRVPALYGLLLHRAGDLLGPHGEELYKAMQSLKEHRLVTKIGVSVYDPDELTSLVARFPMDLVQVPFNIVDRRLATSGWLSRLKERGVEIHVRSVFLQGLLLMPGSKRPSSFRRWQPLWHAWDGWLAETGASPLRACLGFALSHSGVDRIVVGIDTVEQLSQVLAAAVSSDVKPPSELSSEDPDLVNPSRWRRE